MKLMACDLCQSVIVLTLRKRKCRCGNIGGKYCRDGRTVKIWVKNKDKARILGLWNGVRYGLIQEGKVWIIDWDDPVIKVVKLEIINS